MNRLSRVLAVVALVPLAGCARYEVVAEGPPRTTMVEDSGLSAHVWALPDGAVNLRVDRETRVKHEQDLVRRRADAEMPAVRVASTAMSNSGAPVAVDGEAALFVIPILAAAGVAYVIYYGTAFLVGQISELIVYRLPRIHARSTVTWEDVQSKPSPAVTLELADGTAPLDLGPQPFAGYDLDAATVRRFGPPGTAVVVRDGELRTTVVLQPVR